jgi:hypothetical protein
MVVMDGSLIVDKQTSCFFHFPGANMHVQYFGEAECSRMYIAMHFNE